QVAPVTLGAHTAACCTREHGADLDALDARLFDLLGQCFGNLPGRLDEHLARRWVGNLLERHATHDAVAESFDNFATRVDNRARFETIERAAIGFADDHVLRHVDESACEVAG